MKRYELTFDHKTMMIEPREKADGRFMLAEEVLSVSQPDSRDMALCEALKEAYEHNQNMHCFKTTGTLNKALNAQTKCLRDALAIPHAGRFEKFMRVVECARKFVPDERVIQKERREIDLAKAFADLEALGAQEP